MRSSALHLFVLAKSITSHPYKTSEADDMSHCDEPLTRRLCDVVYNAQFVWRAMRVASSCNLLSFRLSSLSAPTSSHVENRTRKP
jgi:hypothetical protein